MIKGRPIKLQLTVSEKSDIASAERLITELPEGAMLLASNGNNANAREAVRSRKAWANIPPRANRRDPVCLSTHFYKARNLVERCFNRIKQFQRIATRYDKLAKNFLAGVKLASIRVWLRALSVVARVQRQIRQSSDRSNTFFGERFQAQIARTSAAPQQL